MNRICALGLGTVALLLGACSHPEIVFVDATLSVDDKVTIDKISRLRGKLTPRKLHVAHPDWWRFRVLDANGKQLYEGDLHEPRPKYVQVYNEDGSMEMVPAATDKPVPIVVRYPYHEDAYTLELRRMDPSKGDYVVLATLPLEGAR